MVVVIAMAWCFAATLIVAGVAKLIAPAPLAALLDRLPRPRVAARLLGLIEVGSGAAPFVGLSGAYLAVGCVYLALACGGEYLLRTGTRGSCGCLGSAKSQLSVGHVLFNLIGGAVCLAAAVEALSSPVSSPLQVASGATVGLITAQITAATWLCTRLFDEASTTWNAWNNPWWGRSA